MDVNYAEFQVLSKSVNNISKVEIRFLEEQIQIDFSFKKPNLPIHELEDIIKVVKENCTGSLTVFFTGPMGIGFNLK